MDVKVAVFVTATCALGVAIACCAASALGGLVIASCAAATLAVASMSLSQSSMRAPTEKDQLRMMQRRHPRQKSAAVDHSLSDPCPSRVDGRAEMEKDSWLAGRPETAAWANYAMMRYWSASGKFKMQKIIAKSIEKALQKSVMTKFIGNYLVTRVNIGPEFDINIKSVRVVREDQGRRSHAAMSKTSPDASQPVQNEGNSARSGADDGGVLQFAVEMDIEQVHLRFSNADEATPHL